MARRRLVFVLSSIFGMFAALALYIALHEGGHALVALLCGARVTAFSILNAFMAYEGGSFGAFTAPLFHAAGMLLPVCLALAFLLACKRKPKRLFPRLFIFYACALPLFSVLAWVFGPLTFLLGAAPAGDDVTRFLRQSSAPPLLVALAALLLFGAYAAVFVKSGLPRDFVQTAKALNEKESAPETPKRSFREDHDGF